MLKDRWSITLLEGGGAGVLHMRLITSPYKTTYINKHNDCCHMENFEMAKKRVIRTMSCVLLLGCAKFIPHIEIKSHETGNCQEIQHCHHSSSRN
jgi:hypothetical protein